MNKKTAFSVGAKLFQKMAFIKASNVINALLVANVLRVAIGYRRIVFGLSTQKANKPILSLQKNMGVPLRLFSERLTQSEWILGQPFQAMQTY